MSGLTDLFVRKVRSALGLSSDPGATPDLALLGLYRATVVSQNADGTLDVQPEDARISGYKNVRVRVGIPGATAQVQPGGVVLIGWEKGDPSRPYCAPSWETNVTVMTLTLTASTVNIGSANGALALPTKADFDNHTHLAGTLTAPSGTAGGPVTGASGKPSVASTGTQNLRAV